MEEEKPVEEFVEEEKPAEEFEALVLWISDPRTTKGRMGHVLEKKESKNQGDEAVV